MKSVNLNKFAAESSNVYHIIWITSIHYLVKFKILIAYHWVVRERNSRIYLVLTVASKFIRFEFQHVRNTVKKLHKTSITDSNEPKQQLRT